MQVLVVEEGRGLLYWSSRNNYKYLVLVVQLRVPGTFYRDKIMFCLVASTCNEYQAEVRGPGMAFMVFHNLVFNGFNKKPNYFKFP
jgi:hypothetical protein